VKTDQIVKLMAAIEMKPDAQYILFVDHSAMTADTAQRLTTQLRSKYGERAPIICLLRGNPNEAVAVIKATDLVVQGLPMSEDEHSAVVEAITS
jgi:hypothetical protein